MDTVVHNHPTIRTSNKTESVTNHTKNTCNITNTTNNFHTKFLPKPSYCNSMFTFKTEQNVHFSCDCSTQVGGSKILLFLTAYIKLLSTSSKPSRDRGDTHTPKYNTEGRYILSHIGLGCQTANLGGRRLLSTPATPHPP